MPKVLLAGCGAGFLALLWLIVLSAREMGLTEGVRELTRTWWGITTLVDVYLGLFAAGLWALATERRRWVGVLWLVAMLALGNLALLALIGFRCLRARTIKDVIMPHHP